MEPEPVALYTQAKVLDWPASMVCEAGATDETTAAEPTIVSAEVVTDEAFTNPMLFTVIVTVNIWLFTVTCEADTDIEEVSTGLLGTTLTATIFVFADFISPELSSVPAAFALKESTPVPMPVYVQVKEAEAPAISEALAGTGPVM